MSAVKKVLFVCSANLDRSPTAEELFNRWNGWEAKSAGVNPALGRRPLTQDLIDWASAIFVMEQSHADYVRTHFACGNRKIRVLDISNRFLNGDPDLIKELKSKVTPLLQSEELESHST